MTRRNSSSGCGPFLLIVRIAMPPPAVFTAMCSEPSAPSALSNAASTDVGVHHVARVERRAHPGGDLGAGRLRQVEDRDLRAGLPQRLRGRAGHARRAADDHRSLSR